MSTSIYGNFYLNSEKKVGKEVCLNEMKELLDGWNWAEELTPVFNDKVKDAFVFWREDFLGYVKNEKVPTNFMSRIETDGDKVSIHLTKDEIFPDEIIAEPTIEELRKDDFFSNYVLVYFHKKTEYKGYWFNQDSFYKARIVSEQNATKHRNELNRLLNIKNSVEYYRLTTEQKDDLNEDINYHQDMVEEFENRIYICRHMSDLLETVAELFGDDYSDTAMLSVYLA